MLNGRYMSKKSRAPGRLIRGGAVLAFWLGAIVPVHAVTYTIQLDDATDALIGIINQDGAEIFRTTIGGEAFTNSFFFIGEAQVAADFDLRFNIYDPDRVTLSDTWRLFTLVDTRAQIGIPFFSHVDGAPALTPLAPASGAIVTTIIETGAFQEVTRFNVSNGDTYIWQFRSDVEQTTVPEPATLALLGLGLAGLAASRRRKLN